MCLSCSSVQGSGRQACAYLAAVCFGYPCPDPMDTWPSTNCMHRQTGSAVGKVHPLARSINHEVSAHGACKSWSVRVWCVAVRCCQEGLNGRGRRARFTWNPCFWQGIVAPHKKAKDQACSRNVGKMGIHPCPLGPYSRLLRPGGFPLHCM